MKQHVASLIFASLILITGGSVHATEAAIPIEQFTSKDRFSTPRLSPDGKHIAVTTQMQQGGRSIPIITIYALPDMKAVGMLRLHIFEVPLNYLWLTNTRLVLRKGLELGELEQPVSTGEIIAFDLDGTNQEYLFGYDMFRSSSRGDRLDDDHGYARINGVPLPRNSHVFLSAQEWDRDRSKLYDVDSKKAHRKTLADIAAPRLQFVQQRNSVPRFAYGWDDKNEPVLYRLDDVSGQWRLTPPIPKQTTIPFHFTMDDSAFFATHAVNGGPEALVREELASGKRVVLAQDPVSDLSSVMYGANEMPFAVSHQLGRTRAIYLDANSADARLHKQLSASFPDEYVRFINFTDDGTTLLFSVYSDRDPGSYYLYDKTSNKAELLYSTMPGIDPDRMAERRPIAFKARDGLQLHGYLTMPKHAPGVKLPLVVMPHGGPHGVYDTWSFDSDAQFLASRGYAVLQVNFRGSGGRGETFIRAGYRQWGEKIQDDILDGLAAVIAEGEVDAGRVCSYGASFGAYSAMMLTIRAPGTFKCAIGYAGVYELRLFKEEDDARRHKYIRHAYQDYIGENNKELDAISPSRLADRIKVPVLLVHGDKDKTAPPEHAELMRKALVRAGNTPQWMMAQNEGHGFYMTKNATAFYQQLESFLAEHIGK
ncbi:alpha/beta hydrolase family protein [Janthinobacterium lividum]